MARRKRQERPRLRPYRLTARDWKLLRAVGRMKLAETRQLTTLFFSSRSAASRRLAKLVALSLLRVFVVGLSRDNLYGLTDRARDLLVERDVDANELHVARSISLASLGHIIAINELRIALMRAVRSQENVRLTLFRSDWDLRRLAGLKLPSYVPDILMQLTSRAHAGTRGYAVEIDLATESTGQLRSRFRALRELRESGGSCWGLVEWTALFVAPTERRLRTLREQAARVEVEHNVHFGLLTEAADLILDAACRTNATPT